MVGSIFDGISEFILPSGSGGGNKPLGQKIRDLFVDIAGDIGTAIWQSFNRPLVQELKTEVAAKSIIPERFKTPMVRERAETLKEKWSHSPETPSDVANDLIELVMGQGAKFQAEYVLGQQFTEAQPVSKRMYSAIGMMTDAAMLSSTISIIGEMLSIGQVDKLGDEMRAYYQYSGLDQITGFGYGQILNSGIGPLIAQEVSEMVRPTLLSPGQYQEALNRQFIQRDVFRSHLSRNGYSEALIDVLEKTATYQPTAPDLVRFAVRDVYNPRIVQEYGLDSDFPADFIADARKAGLDEVNARRYWQAHWELPSLTQGYDMFQRAIITEAQLKDLMRAQDVMPVWRDRLIKLNYNPLTRVDVRRMYKDGVLTRQQVYRCYLDIGYSPENAEALTRWTEEEYAQETEEGRAFTKAEILKAYALKEIDRSNAERLLQGLEYSVEQADMLLDMQDTADKEKADDDEAALAQAEYVNGGISLDELKSRLEGLTITERKRMAYLNAAIRTKRSGTPSPSAMDLHGFYSKSIIPEATYRDRLGKLGYEDDVIGWFVEANAPEGESKA